MPYGSVQRFPTLTGPMPGEPPALKQQGFDPMSLLSFAGNQGASSAASASGSSWGGPTLLATEALGQIGGGHRGVFGGKGKFGRAMSGAGKGAVIGSFFGGPAGAAIGAPIGALINLFA